MSAQSSQHKMTWLKSLITSNKRQIALALLLGVITYACAVLLMFTSGYLISKTAASLTTLFAVMVPIACVQLFGLGRPVARYFERLVSHDWIFRATSHLRVALFQAARKQGATGKESALGTYLSVLGDDIAHLQNLFLRVVFPTIVALLLWLGACIVCGFFSWTLLIIMICCGGACVFVLPYIAFVISRTIIRQAQEQQGEEYRKLTDDILGSVDIRLAGRSGQTIKQHEQTLTNLDSIRAHIRLANRIIELISALIMCITCVLMLIANASLWGGVAEMQNWIAAFALGLFPLLEVFVLLPASLTEVTKHQGAIENLDEFLHPITNAIKTDEAQAESLPTAARQQSSNEPASQTLAAQAASPSACASHNIFDNNIEIHPAGSVNLEGLFYTYPKANVPALKDINLVIEAGSKVALIGRSGSGKSTLLNIIQGTLEPTEGKLTIATDPNTSGVASLNQAPYIFDRTLKENLSLANPHATEDAMTEMLIRSGLKEKFNSLQKGLLTHIGETGEGFSGGEAHRIALTRTLLTQPNVLLLDEPFNALDPETEAALLDTVFESCKNCTLIVATHHLTEIDRFDRVVVMDDSSILLNGSPTELLETSQEFKDLVEFDR